MFQMFTIAIRHWCQTILSRVLSIYIYLLKDSSEIAPNVQMHKIIYTIKKKINFSYSFWQEVNGMLIPVS